jgi:hypothetical protein
MSRLPHLGHFDVAVVQTAVEAIYDVWHYLPQMREAVGKFEAHFTALLAA